MDAEAGHHRGDEAQSLLVGVVGDDDVLPLVAGGEDGGGDGAHAAVEKDAALRPFQGRQLLLGRLARGVPVASVLVVLDPALGECHHLRDVLEYEGAGVVDGGGYAPHPAVLAVMHGYGVPVSLRVYGVFIHGALHLLPRRRLYGRPPPD